MSLIGNIVGSAFRNLIPPLAQSAIRAIAPAATSLLNSIVGTGFTAAKYALPFAIATALPGPLGILAGTLLAPLIGKGADALKNFTQNGIRDFVGQVVGAPHEREVVGSSQTGSVVRDTLATVAQNYGRSSVGETLGNAVSNFFGMGGSSEDSIANRASMMREPATPPEGASEGEMLKYQAALQKYARLMDMYSKIIQAHHDMKKGIIANFRV
jgi:hypothetical protein